jgi:hypothetical protein
MEIVFKFKNLSNGLIIAFSAKNSIQNLLQYLRVAHAPAY